MSTSKLTARNAKLLNWSKTGYLPYIHTNVYISLARIAQNPLHNPPTMNNYLIHLSLPHYHLGIHRVSSNVSSPCGKTLNNNHSLTAILWSTLQVCGFCFLGYFGPPPNNWLTVIQYLEWHAVTQWEWYVSTLQSKVSLKLFLFLFPFGLILFWHLAFVGFEAPPPGCFEHNHLSQYMIQHYSFCPTLSPSN